jgi:hypothetical protein
MGNGAGVTCERTVPTDDKDRLGLCS